MNDNFQVGHAGWSPDYNSNKSKPLFVFRADRIDQILFIYALDGVIKCLSAEEIQEEELLAAGWKHTATIDPARWIEAMANGHQEPSDMLDELQNRAADRGCCVSTCSLSLCCCPAGLKYRKSLIEKLSLLEGAQFQRHYVQTEEP